MPPVKKQEIGKRISHYRKQKNLTVNRLANLCGISQSYLRNIELGLKNPSIEIISTICDTLEISLSTFFSSSQPDFTNDPLSIELQHLNQHQRDTLCEFIRSLKNNNLS